MPRSRRTTEPRDVPPALSGLSVPAITSLIPLVARAQARTQFPELGFADEMAEQMVRELGIPLDMFGSNPEWLRGSVLRAKWFDDRCRAILRDTPNGMVIALGAELDTRCQRLGLGAIDWVDVDLPAVTALKRRFAAPSGTCRLIACDVTGPAWLGQTGWQPDTPLVLTAEGLLMYLAPRDVRTLFRRIADRFSGGTARVSLLFDYASPPLVLNSWMHPALMHTKARFRSGLAGAAAIRAFDQRYEILEDYDISPDCGFATAWISAMYRMMTLGLPFYGLAHAGLRGR